MAKVDFIINRRYADYRHGTGVQLKLFAEQFSELPLHICWDDGYSVPETYRPHLNLDTSWLRYWPFRRGKGLAARVEASIRDDWSAAEQIEERLMPLRASLARPLRAYVVVASESEAKIARRILEAVNATYVLKILDFLHFGPTELSSYPHLTNLLAEAIRVFALTPPIKTALVDISGRHDICVLPDGRVAVQEEASPLKSPIETIEIVMIGSLDYPIGLVELSRFCTALIQQKVSFRLNYIGPQTMRDRLGPEVPVHYHGVLSNEQRDALMTCMHLAYLPGPDGDPSTDYLARFSFPSRLMDYFWHGLPVVGTLQQGTATYQILNSLQSQGVWFSTDGFRLVEVVRELAVHSDAWRRASSNVRLFAEKHYSIQNVADVVVQSFDER